MKTQVLVNDRPVTWEDYSKTFLTGVKKARRMLREDKAEYGACWRLMVSHFEQLNGVYPSGFKPRFLRVTMVEIGQNGQLVAINGH